MAVLGDRVVFKTHSKHHTTTKKGNDVEHEGSVFHYQLRSFAGFVGRVHPASGKGSKDPQLFDIAILVPGSDKVAWIEHVCEGTSPGKFEVQGSEKAS